jgi:hypothetical protein
MSKGGKWEIGDEGRGMEEAVVWLVEVMVAVMNRRVYKEQRDFCIGWRVGVTGQRGVTGCFANLNQLKAQTSMDS